jgi:hypothetical protein
MAKFMHRTSGKISLILDFKVFQKCSIGGEYGGKNNNLQPEFSIKFFALVDL